jgi:hypothetical protein
MHGHGPAARVSSDCRLTQRRRLPRGQGSVRMRRKGHEVWAERLSYSGLLSEARALLMGGKGEARGSHVL